MKKSKKRRAVPSAAPGVNYQWSGELTSAQRAPNGTEPEEGFAADRLAKFVDGRVEDVRGVGQDGGELAVDASLDRLNRRARASYQTGLASNPGADYRQPAAKVAALDKAIRELDQAAARVRASKRGDQFDALDRLSKARQTCVTARAAILAKAESNDESFRIRAGRETSDPGITTAAAQIAALQRRR